MTATREQTEDRRSPEVARTCPACGAELTDDQEWCLECGTATTLIHSSPDWWVPVAVIGIVVAVALAGLIYALSRV
jgi:ferredoxin-like protein FixX